MTTLGYRLYCAIQYIIDTTIKISQPLIISPLVIPYVYIIS